MKQFLLPLLSAVCLAAPSNSDATDFQFTCEWIVDGEVASSVTVESYNFLPDQRIEVALPQTSRESAMKADFDFFEFDSVKGSALVEIIKYEGAPHDRPNDTQPAHLFDGIVNFEWGKPATVFTSKSEETEKALVFTLTPPENKDAFVAGTELTKEEIAKLDYSTHISSGTASLTIYNGNSFKISSALVRIKSTDEASEDKIDRAYSVKLSVSAHDDEYSKINDAMRLSEQKYEITIEAAYR